MLKLCGLAILTAMLAFMLREVGGGRFSVPLSIFAGICLLLPLLTSYQEIITFLTKLSENTLFTEGFSLSVKALGVGLLASFSADVCREMGEATLGERVELCGKAEILVLSLPLLSELLTLCVGFMGA